MKKSMILSVVVMAALALTACAEPLEPVQPPDEPFEELPPIEEPPELPPLEPEPEEPEPIETPIEEATPVPTEEPEITEVIPETGPVDPGLASNLLDFEVWNQDGSLVIGAVDELILDLQIGSVAYVVVAEEMVERLVPVPYELFLWDDVEMKFLLVIDQEVFDNAPEFIGGEIPDTTMPDWDTEFKAYWEGVLTP